MTVEIAIVLGVVLVALALFAWDRVPVDATAVGLVVVLAGSGLVTVEQALAGFSSPATVTIAAMFVLSEGLRRTGALDSVGDLLARLGDRDERVAVAVMMLVVAVVSAFINNTAAVAIFIPVVVDMAGRIGTSPSRLLVPLSFASMFGGVSTLIGTSTNLLVDSIAVEEGLPGFGVFEFAPLGLGLFVVGFAYLWVVQPHIPARRSPDADDMSERYGLDRFLLRLRLGEDGPGVGERLQDEPLRGALDVELVDLERGGTRLDRTGARLRAGDVVRVRGTVAALEDALDVDGVELVPADGDVSLDEELTRDGRRLVEVVLSPDSPLTGRSLADVDLASRLGVAVLGVRSPGSTEEALDDVQLRGGDVVLLLVPTDRLDAVRDDRGVVVVSEEEPATGRRDRMPVALATVAAVVLLAATGVVPVVVAAVAGCLAMLAGGVLRGAEAYAAINGKVILLLAGVIPLGTALETTGGAQLLADAIVSSLSRLGPLAVLAGLFVTTQLVTAVISNNASAVLFAPIAIGAAEGLGVSPRPMLFAVTVAASMSFLTPVGYQTNTMIYGPGDYRFSDFLRVGGPLTLLVAVAATVLVPRIWPF